MHPLPRRSLLRRIMAMVVIATWLALNLYIWVLFEIDLPSHDSVRVTVFEILAGLVSLIAGGLVAWGVWRRFPGPADSAVEAVLYGMLAGALAGMVAWFATTILLCIGHGAADRASTFALSMGVLGAIFHIIPGLLLGGILWRPRVKDDRGGDLEFQDG